jgi:hypothetical protein
MVVEHKETRCGRASDLADLSLSQCPAAHPISHPLHLAWDAPVLKQIAASVPKRLWQSLST